MPPLHLPELLLDGVLVAVAADELPRRRVRVGREQREVPEPLSGRRYLRLVAAKREAPVLGLLEVEEVGVLLVPGHRGVPLYRRDVLGIVAHHLGVEVVVQEHRRLHAEPDEHAVPDAEYLLVLDDLGVRPVVADVVVRADQPLPVPVDVGLGNVEADGHPAGDRDARVDDGPHLLLLE